MADRFDSSGISAAIVSGLSNAAGIEAELQQASGAAFPATGQSQIAVSTSQFTGSSPVTPPNNTTLGGKTASTGTDFDKLQWRVDFGNGFERLFRIDNIGETGIVTGEGVTVESGSLNCGTKGLANILRDGLSNVTIDVNVLDAGGTTQASFNNLLFTYLDTSSEFNLGTTLSFKNNSGASFTLSTIEATADNDTFFTVNRSDNVPDGANVDINSLSLTITNLS